MKFVCGWLVAGLSVSLVSAAQTDEAADALVAKAIKASGGMDKIAKLKAGSCKGKVMFQEGGQDISFAMDLSWQGLKQFRIEAEAAFGGMVKNATVVINGDKGWVKEGDKVKEIPNEIAPLLRDVLYGVRLPHMLADMRGKDVKVSVIGEVKVGQRDAIAMSVSRTDYKDVTFSFDKETGLPLKSEIRVTDPNGKEITVDFTYLDYKEVDGLKHCTKIAIRADGKEFNMELSELRPQGTLDASVFAEPK